MDDDRTGSTARAVPPHRPAVDRLVQAVLETPGRTSAAERAAIFRGNAVEGPLGTYAAMVRSASERITDADVARLHEAGLDDDAVFEATLAAAVGAAIETLDAGLRALVVG